MGKFLDRVRDYTEALVDAIRGFKLYRPGDIYGGRPPAIRFGPKVYVKRESKSKLNLRGTFRFGYCGLEDGMRLQGRPSQIILSKNSLIETNGAVQIGSGTMIWVGENAKLVLGDKVFFNIDCKLYVSEYLEVGDYSALAWDITIMDNDFHGFNASGEGEVQKSSAPIIIGKHVWVGASCRIQKGVTIGDGAVIAAGSVITGDIPAGSFVAGAPAQVLKSDVSWSY